MPLAAMLLENPEGRGYPFPYVLARIHGRRTQTAGLAAAAVRVEQRWLWGQMEPRRRRVFAPLFCYFELKPLILALRRREARQWEGVSALLAESLLARPLRQVLGDDRLATGAALERLGRLLQPLLPESGALRAGYASGGISAVEEQLLGAVLGAATAPALHPLLRSFIARLIDNLNLLTLYREERWRPASAAPFVAGGGVRSKQLDAWRKGRASAARDACAVALTGRRTLPESPAELEAALLDGTTRFCRRLAREPEGVGLVVDYLWNLSLAGRSATTEAG